MNRLVRLWVVGTCWCAHQAAGAEHATIAINNYGAAPIQLHLLGAPLTASEPLPTAAWVQVFAGLWGGESLAALTEPFHPVEPGYFDVGVYTIPHARPDYLAAVQVRAWLGAATFEGAPLLGEILFVQETGSWEDGVGSGLPPGPKTGPNLLMPGFQVRPNLPIPEDEHLRLIPEPSTFALTLLGMGALLLRSRRKPVRASAHGTTWTRK